MSCGGVPGDYLNNREVQAQVFDGAGTTKREDDPPHRRTRNPSGRCPVLMRRTELIQRACRNASGWRT